MTSTNKKTDAISRLREMAPQEPRPADDAAKLHVHRVSLAHDVRRDAAIQRSFAGLRPAEDSQSLLRDDGRETKSLLSFEAPRPAQQADSRSMAWRSSA
ncbi:hypothetical protein [Ensifer adhaerens]|uniref:hypothetical protein n=1 Tax=Ensifer adhaerens TaxID=106592 RepID=UPI000DC261E1|nr:hypothetical protein [Ensifer adhaerens]RAS10610.1 hypothetical protein DEU52_112151 [Ensifer adhaerens]